MIPIIPTIPVIPGIPGNPGPLLTCAQGLPGGGTPARGSGGSTEGPRRGPALAPRSQWERAGGSAPANRKARRGGAAATTAPGRARRGRAGRRCHSPGGSGSTGSAEGAAPNPRGRSGNASGPAGTGAAAGERRDGPRPGFPRERRRPIRTARFWGGASGLNAALIGWGSHAHSVVTWRGRVRWAVPAGSALMNGGSLIVN